MDMSGRNVRHLAEDLVVWGDFLAAHGIPMSWSPDNRKIALSATCLEDDCGIPKIYTVDVATGQTEELAVTTKFRTIGFEPVWSLDGQFLAFQGEGYLDLPKWVNEFVVVHIDGDFAYSTPSAGYGRGSSVGWGEKYIVDMEIFPGRTEEVNVYVMDIMDWNLGVRLNSQFVFREDENLVAVSVKDRKTGIELSTQTSPDGRWRVESQFGQEGWDIILIDVATNETQFLVTGIHTSWRPRPASENN